MIQSKRLETSREWEHDSDLYKYIVVLTLKQNSNLYCEVMNEITFASILFSSIDGCFLIA